MRRLLALGAAILLVLGIIAAVAVTLGLGRSQSAPPPTNAATSGGLQVAYLGPGQRSQPYSGFKVQFTNGTADTVTNPQTRVLVDLQDRQWRCQGYTDPASGTVVWEVADVTNHPLLIPAGQQVAVEILCRVPDVPLDTAQVRLQ
jgi:hypothetical protein